MSNRSGKSKAVLIIGVFTFVSLSLSALFALSVGEETLSEQSREYSRMLFEKLGLENIDDLDVRVENTDVEIKPSPDGKLGVKADIWTMFRKNERIHFEIKNNRLTLRIDKNKPSGLSINTGRQKEFLEIFIPPGRLESLSVRSSSGDIELAGSAFGNLRLETRSGDIDLKGFSADDFSLQTESGSAVLKEIKAGSLRVDSVSGDLSLEDIAVENGALLTTVSGSQDAERLSARSLKATSKSGDIGLIDLSVGEDLNVESVSGDCRASAKEPVKGIEAQSVSGDIDLRLSPDQRALLCHATVSGKLNNTHPAISANSAADEGAGSSISIRTVSGDATIGTYNP